MDMEHFYVEQGRGEPVIAGTKGMIQEEHTRLIAKSISNAGLAFIHGDHFIAAKNPEEFSQKILDFLGK